MSSKPNPFDFKCGRMPQSRDAFPKAWRECERLGIDPRSELTWGPVPLQDNLLLALHPAPSKWAWEAALAFAAELLRAGPFHELWYVYHKTRWHLLVTKMTPRLDAESLAFGRISLDAEGRARLVYEGIS